MSSFLRSISSTGVGPKPVKYLNVSFEYSSGAACFGLFSSSSSFGEDGEVTRQTTDLRGPFIIHKSRAEAFVGHGSDVELEAQTRSRGSRCVGLSAFPRLSPPIPSRSWTLLPFCIPSTSFLCRGPFRRVCRALKPLTRRGRYMVRTCDSSRGAPNWTRATSGR